jgi:hypothetical protein
MKKFGTIIILIICFFIFGACKKKLFKHVAVQGRMLNYITKSPLTANVYVSAYEARGSRNSVDLGHTQTGNDGSFSIRTSAVRTGKYYIDIIGSQPLYGGEFIIPDGSTKDFGDVLAGQFTFICKVTIVPVSTSAIDFPFLETGALHFNAGTATQFVTTQTIKAYDFSNVFTIAFDTSGTRTFRKIPISSSTPQDTLFTTINY